MESAAQISLTSFSFGLLLAFLGGIILNLMPCVFPVLSLKIFGFLKEPKIERIRRSAWAYTAGAVLTFTLIGALLTLLRYWGEAVGWGYQLQNPWLVYLLALLFFLMGLNFFGFFEVGNQFVSIGSRLGKKSFLTGDFGTGVLAVVVASPCTAPFMGSALGLTLLLPAGQSLFIFAALGLGMAAPMLALAYVPRLIGRLPKSGPWMVTLKQFMTFPLFLTSLWLLWILQQQRGSESVFVALLSFILLTMTIWMFERSKGALVRALLTFLFLLNPLASLYSLQKAGGLDRGSPSSLIWHDFDPAVVEEKRKTEIVFIDFTASWCLSCQVNKKTVLETAEIEELFRKHRIFLVRADWTNLNPVVTKALEQLGRASIPLYVAYSRNEKPVLFPEVLTKSMLIRYFDGGVLP